MLSDKISNDDGHFKFLVSSPLAFYNQQISRFYADWLFFRDLEPFVDRC